MSAKIIVFGNKISCGATQALYKILEEDVFKSRMAAANVQVTEADFRASRARYLEVKKAYKIIVTNGSIRFPQIIVTDAAGKALDIFMAYASSFPTPNALASRIEKVVKGLPDTPPVVPEVPCPECVTCPKCGNVFTPAK